jgi:transcriptional regulator with XRE-family HTH domain
LTQTEFGERLHLKGNTITGYETGLRAPSDAIIASICREFNIREEWLREGVGPMAPERTREEELAFLFAQAVQEGNQKRMALLSLGLQLTPDQVSLLHDLALRLAAMAEETKKEQES